jgi:hypothetical protein
MPSRPYAVVGPSLEGADAWLTRAQIHLDQLRIFIRPHIKAERDAMATAIRADLDGPPPYPLTFEFAWPTTYYLPVGVSIYVGESIQAMRRALDYLVYEICYLDSGIEQDGTQFPFDRDPNTFYRRLQRQNSRDTSALLVGMKRTHATVLKAYQPCAGADWATLLQSISNPDKHRHLTVTRNQSAFRMTDQRPLKHHAKVSTPGWDRIRATWPMAPDVHMKLEITVYVGLNDRGSVISSLQEIKDNVARALDEFRPCFAGQCPH